jgi:hypothetical protein
MDRAAFLDVIDSTTAIEYKIFTVRQMPQTDPTNKLLSVLLLTPSLSLLISI